MQAIFKSKILVLRVIGDDEFGREGPAERQAVFGGEFREQGGGGGIGQAQAQNQAAIAQLGNLAQVPDLDAGKAVGRLAFARSEPGKNHGDAAADGRACLEAAKLAHEQEGRLVFELEMSQVGAVQV